MKWKNTSLRCRAPLFQDPRLHYRARLAQLRAPLARHQRVRVKGAHDDAGNARFQDSVGAGWRFAPMAARLQCDVQGASGGVFVACGQRLPLRVGLAACGVPALADDAAVFHDNGTYEWVWAGPASPSLGKRQRTGHEGFVACELL